MNKLFGIIREIGAEDIIARLEADIDDIQTVKTVGVTQIFLELFKRNLNTKDLVLFQVMNSLAIKNAENEIDGLKKEINTLRRQLSIAMDGLLLANGDEETIEKLTELNEEIKQDEVKNEC